MKPKPDGRGFRIKTHVYWPPRTMAVSKLKQTLHYSTIFSAEKRFNGNVVMQYRLKRIIFRRRHAAWIKSLPEAISFGADNIFSVEKRFNGNVIMQYRLERIIFNRRVFDKAAPKTRRFSALWKPGFILLLLPIILIKPLLKEAIQLGKPSLLYGPLSWLTRTLRDDTLS